MLLIYIPKFSNHVLNIGKVHFAQTSLQNCFRHCPDFMGIRVVQRHKIDKHILYAKLIFISCSGISFVCSELIPCIFSLINFHFMQVGHY